MIDIEQILTLHGIDYSTQGANVQEGNININCPLCGDDPSYHLGINLENGVWGCWRNQAHRGRLPFLLALLLKCSIAEATKLVGDAAPILKEDDLQTIIRALDEGPAAPTPTQMLQGVEVALPDGCREIKPDGMRSTFWDYLKGRGFPKPAPVISRYGLRACLMGPFAYRLIFPIYQNEKLISWTGRAIRPADVKYKFPPGISVKDYLYNYDMATLGGETLFVCEGPFDAIKLDYFGWEYGGAAVALFGRTMTARQREKMLVLAAGFERVAIILDDDAVAEAWAVRDALAQISPVVLHLPEGTHDPGELKGRDVGQLCGSDWSQWRVLRGGATKE